MWVEDGITAGIGGLLRRELTDVSTPIGVQSMCTLYRFGEGR